MSDTSGQEPSERAPDPWGTGPPGYPPPGQQPGYPPQPRQGAPTSETPEPEGFFETLVGVITVPADTLRRVTAHPKVGWAIVVLVGVALLNGIVGAGQFEAQLQADPAVREMLPPEIEGVGAGAWAVMSVVAALLGTLLGAVVVHLAAKLLSGTGTFGGQFSGFGIAYFPWAFGIVAGLLGTVGGGMAVLGSLLSFALFVWVLVLGVIATRENHGFSTGHAVGAVAIGAVLLVVGVVAIVLLIGLLIIGLLAALFG